MPETTTVGYFSTFNSARHFASWVGLTLLQVGTAGKTHQLGISKRSDTYLQRALLIYCHSVVTSKMPMQSCEYCDQHETSHPNCLDQQQGEGAPPGFGKLLKRCLDAQCCDRHHQTKT